MHITAPFNSNDLKKLKAGDSVKLSGTIYTARDAAHKNLVNDIADNKALPLDLKNQCIYYAGPCPSTPEEVIGPIGPTTSYRQDPYTPTLLENGLKGMIGKGDRSEEVVNSMIKNGCVYFVAIGGGGLLVSRAVKSVEIIGYSDLGTEAIRKLEVENLDLIVAIDSQGNNLYKRK